MNTPLVGVIGSAYSVENRYMTQLTGESNMRAVRDVAGAMPMVFAGSEEITRIEDLLNIVDGILLTGARANVHPSRFDTVPHEAYEPYDESRDEMALSVCRACVDRAIPIFGICRGMQEMNVAFGGSLHPEIRDLPGRMNHRMPRLENGEIHPDPQVLFADRHEVRFKPEGKFAKLFGSDSIRVNSLHGQAVWDVGERVIVEGRAEDDTIEAISISDAPGFALGVQWHAEFDPQTNPVNRTLFKAFGEAIHANKARKMLRASA